jgi:hypothetical protein
MAACLSAVPQTQSRFEATKAPHKLKIIIFDSVKCISSSRLLLHCILPDSQSAAVQCAQVAIRSQQHVAGNSTSPPHWQWTTSRSSEARLNACYKQQSDWSRLHSADQVRSASSAPVLHVSDDASCCVRHHKFSRSVTYSTDPTATAKLPHSATCDACAPAAAAARPRLCTGTSCAAHAQR